MHNTLDLIGGDLPGLALLSSAVLAVLVAVEVAGRTFQCPHEWTRKAAHVGSGLVLLAVPWLIEGPASLAVVAIGFATALAASRRLGLFASIHRVPRHTDGVILFPIGVTAVFALADGDPLR